VPDEHHIGEAQLVADLEHVIGVALQRRIAVAAEGSNIRAAGADVIEEHDSVAVGERGPDVAPHVLIAAESVCEEHGLSAGEPVLADVVAGGDAHVRKTLRGRSRRR
jgi:hypothetical protein